MKYLLYLIVALASLVPATVSDATAVATANSWGAAAVAQAGSPSCSIPAPPADPPASKKYCGPPCSEDEYLYDSGCECFLDEATCENPCPKPGTEKVCDYMKCYCKYPKVRHGKKCIDICQCPRLCGKK